MKDNLSQYVQSVSQKFSHEETSEMGYRADFEILLKEIFQSINVKRIDHDARAKQGNKPDFVVLKNDVPILYIETKDIGVSLDKIEKSEQMSRYYGYANLVLTDYLEFRFYRNGEAYGEPIKIGEGNLKERTLKAVPQHYDLLAKTLVEFTQSYKEPIKSGQHLAKIMGGKAQRIRDNVKQFLSVESEHNKELLKVYEAIKKMLVHDLTPETFSDMYAQTLVYGLFAARYYDESPDTFSREEARELVPASNPFLRHFFDHIAGPDFDKRLRYIVDELCEVFQHADMKRLVEEYMDDADPIIHFYEDFLKEYDPALRKRMGAYYTPLPVVNFIVRSVDEILRRDFGLAQGLADTTKLPDGRHKVQILDPAVGTGTFISAAIDQIYKGFQEQNQGGRWPSYVHHDLLPRLYGFELMMSPYTIAHLKISLKLKETGFKYFNETRDGKARLKVYLTNSLEQPEKQQNLLSFGLAESIAEEAKQAAVVKNETPIMVVIGNPPYSVSSSNKGAWIQDLIQEYKKGLGEKKINLDDDYIKFLRFAEHFIERNKTGVVAMITNNSFIDGITHRQMRKHLLETFDDIYILDLHGNSTKGEQAPDGSKDENVFDIKQGVSINILVRKGKDKKELGNIFHAEIFGKRINKFTFLEQSNINQVAWKKLQNIEPNFYFVPKDFSEANEYVKGISIKDLFLQKSTGIETQNDEILLKYNNKELQTLLQEIVHTGDKDDQLCKYLMMQGIDDKKIVQIMHKPFDFRYTYLDNKVLGRARLPFMMSLLFKNVALVCARQYTSRETPGAFVVQMPSAHKSYSANDKTVIFPLYLYAEDGTKTPNLKKEIVSEIEKVTGKVTPENILDYMYAVLHSPSYREKYKEFLKIDFPRVPYPKDAARFKKLVALGAELQSLHLLESPEVSHFITSYPVAGSDTVEKVVYKDGKVFINSEQYFGKVPEIAWNFYIGGYQPAQKWLKDRKGRTLTNEDIEHYQKMIVALTETDRIMKNIDEVGEKNENGS